MKDIGVVHYASLLVDKGSLTVEAKSCKYQKQFIAGSSAVVV